MQIFKKGTYLDEMYKSGQTVFSTREIHMLWRETNFNATNVRLNYYVSVGKLIRLRRSIYAIDKNYNQYELANRIMRPAYISFETVTNTQGVNFQYYERIFVASYVNREIKINGQVFEFVRVNKNLLSSGAGIKQEKTYAIASIERAMLDILYRSKNYYFDNLRGTDWEKVFEILPIYQNKKLEKIINKIYKDFKNQKYDNK